MDKWDEITKMRALALRKNTTPTEKKLWEMLRNRKYRKLKFRRQFPIHPYIADFYCHEIRLVIELDGASHNDADQIEYDRNRNDHMKAQGLAVIRITDTDFIDEPGIVFERIDEFVTGDGF